MHVAKDPRKVGQNYQKCQHLLQKYHLFTNFRLHTTEITLQVHLALNAKQPSTDTNTVLRLCAYS